MIPRNADVEATHGHADTVEVRTFSVGKLLYHVPEFDALPPKAKLAALDDLDDLDPEEEVRDSNTTCVGHSKALVEAGDPTNTFESPTPVALALGDDDTAIPAYSDTTLPGKHGEVPATEYVVENNGEDLKTRTFVSENEGNGGTGIANVGLLDSKGRLQNHSLLASVINKSDNEVATINATISYQTV